MGAPSKTLLLFVCAAHTQALCFDCEEDMIEALAKDTEQFRGKVVIIRWGGGGVDGRVCLFVVRLPRFCPSACGWPRGLPPHMLAHTRVSHCHRYEGPKGGPGMPEMLTPTSAIMGAGLGKVG